MTENLSTGGLDEAGAQQDTGANPPAAEAAKAINAIVTGTPTSVRSISNPRLEMAQAPTLGLPGVPLGSFPALLPGVTAVPRGPI